MDEIDEIGRAAVPARPPVRVGPTPPTSYEKKVGVVKGKVLKKKKSWFESFSETFFGESPDSVRDYLIQDVLIPTVRSTIVEMISSGVDMLLNGKATRSHKSSTRERDREFISYNSYSGRSQPKPRERYVNSSRFNLDEVFFEDEQDAEQVLDTLAEIIDKTGEVSVGEYYDLCNMPSEHTQYHWGWTSLIRASIGSVREGGYILILPKPKPLD